MNEIENKIYNLIDYCHKNRLISSTRIDMAFQIKHYRLCDCQEAHPNIDEWNSIYTKLDFANARMSMSFHGRHILDNCEETVNVEIMQPMIDQMIENLSHTCRSNIIRRAELNELNNRSKLIDCKVEREFNNMIGAVYNE